MRNVYSAYVEDFSMRLQRFIAKFLFATTATRSPTSLAFSNQQVWTGSGEPGVSLSK